MKKTTIIAAILVIISLLSVASCAPKGVDILKQPDDYAGDFYVPSSKKVKDGSLLSVISKINEKVCKVESARKTKSDDATLLESYRISCNGVSIELFHYNEDSEKLKEAREQEKYFIRSSEGEAIAEYYAVANGNYLMMFASSKDSYGNDRTESNEQIADFFKSLTF